MRDGGSGPRQARTAAPASAGARLLLPSGAADAARRAPEGLCFSLVSQKAPRKSDVASALNFSKNPNSGLLWSFFWDSARDHRFVKRKTFKFRCAPSLLFGLKLYVIYGLCFAVVKCVTRRVVQWRQTTIRILCACPRQGKTSGRERAAAVFLSSSASSKPVLPATCVGSTVCLCLVCRRMSSERQRHRVWPGTDPRRGSRHLLSRCMPVHMAGFPHVRFHMT